MTTPRLTGQCACGTLRYATDAEPIVMLNCHCSDCRRASGSAYAALMLLPKARVTLQGEPRFHWLPGGSGAGVERGFCPTCGSPVVARVGKFPDLLAIHAGSLDDPSLFTPAIEVYTAGAPAWDCMHHATTKFAKGRS